MSRKTTLECTKHGLRFEQFDDWHEQKGGPVPDCYICAHEKAIALKQQLDEVTRHRDILLSAIEVKLALPVPQERSLSRD